MGDLREQLKKAKLLSKQRARRLAHEERLHRSEVGRRGLERENQARQAELSGVRAEGREQDRRQQAEVEAVKSASAERAACLQLLADQALAPESGARGRWFFALSDGSLPSLPLNEKQRRQVEAGSLAIVRTGPEGSHRYGLLARNLVERVSTVLPEIFVQS